MTEQSEPTPSLSALSDPILLERFEELLRRLETNGPEAAEPFFAEYPEHAGRLRTLLPTLRRLVDLNTPASPPVTPASDEPRRLGDFEILRKVGEGGMGVVYEAHQVSLGRGTRLDGWTNDDLKIDQDFTGGVMPPEEAVKEGKVKPLSDEDRRTLVRWIDLGCPIDVDPQYDPSSATPRSYGWMGDDQRPTLTLTSPQPGVNQELTRLLIGRYDAFSGLDPASFRVVADFEVDGVAAGEDLASRFKETAKGVWELHLSKPLTALPKGILTISVKDRQGNVNRIERVFSVGKPERR